ncbi:M20 family metallopeptidase [Enhydrobacter sp.]|jgi:acetylornithine deacetylase/succinyl-diaminopimelate desuccinylase-like protein|uniref:M20 family metallopeptidase n=1 Tax=Enhydrobacter sp. TaxID=1894999 RepID=UPI0026247AB4|nr:M20 family metallopeptidase [Enhydrobacter sp.]WIM12333.1 MAG: Succinyl-diaminopimelate desuccinylase [Enhydrobacter sp.]
MDTARLKQFVESFWEDSILPSITEYIRIPNKSPAYDPQWVEHGYMEDAVKLMEGWARRQLAGFAGAKLEVVRLPGRTPLLFIDLPGDSDDTVLLYGHLDKQPEMRGWSEGLGPWLPVRKDDKLYGRGGADDGYAIYACLCALKALGEQNVARARCVIMIEACEESGSYDLPFYVDYLIDRIGNPSLVVCLDSGCGDYDRLWLTTSLRGIAAGTLEVRVLTEGVHSGDASGIVPSSFRILRGLLSRLENEDSGEIKLPELYVQIPPQRIEQAKEAARILGREVYGKFPFAGSTRPMVDDTGQMVLNRTWRPQLAVVGMDGYPAPGDAGNVLLPYSTAKLSLRTPPTLDARKAAQAIKQALEADPPYGAEVTFEGREGQSGWHAPPLVPWLETAVAQASEESFGAPPAYMGEGGTIPFMGMLGEKFPHTQFVITGVLGPHSNAHGPNEFLHIPTGKRVTAAMACLIAAHHRRRKRPESSGG